MLYKKLTTFLNCHAGIFLSLPAFLLLALFVILPFVSAIYDSFTNQSLKTILQPQLHRWVGFDNYAELLTDSEFGRALGNTAFFVVLVTPLQCLLALAMAVMVEGSSLWQRYLRTCFFFPVVTSLAVLAVIWGLLYNPNFGLFNRWLQLIGFPAQPFLTSPSQAMLCIAAMSIWQGAGFQMMLFLAGMKNIPPELYEAAAVEGASRWQRFWRITLPMLRNTAILVITITTIFAFKLFVQPHLLTNGGPEGSTTTLLLQLFHEAFTHNDFARASAVSVIFFVIVLVVSLIQRRLLPREERLT